MEEERKNLNLEALFLILVFVALTLDGVFSKERLGKDLTPAKTFVFLAFSTFLIRSLLKKDLKRLLRPFRNPVTIMFLLYLLVSFLSIANSKYILEPSFQNPIFVVFRRASLFILYYCIVAITCNRKIFGYLVSAFLFSGVLSCLASSYEIVTGRLFLSRFSAEQTDLTHSTAGGIRVSGLDLWPGFQAALLSMLLPFLIQYVFTSKKRSLRFFAAAMTALFVTSIVASGSRTGWIGMFIAISVYLLFSLDSRKRLVYFAGSFGAIILIFVSLSLFTDLAIAERLGIGRRSSGSSAVSFRATHIGILFKVIEDYPMLGIGTGNLLNSYYHYTSVTSAELFKYPPNDPHNGYLQVWAENGTIGMIVFSLLIVFILGQIYFSITESPDKTHQLMAYACLASFFSALWFLSLYPLLDNKYTWASFGLYVAFANITRLAKEKNVSLSHS